MKKLLLSSAIFLSIAAPAYSQTAVTCPIIDHSIPAERRFVVDNEPGYITGTTPGSRVNVRSGPGVGYQATAYGLVGDSIDIIGQAFSLDCETWVQVRFPISGHIGWIHSEFISLYYGRGWWD